MALASEILEAARHEGGPPRLVARAHAAARVAVEVLVDEIAESWPVI